MEKVLEVSGKMVLGMVLVGLVLVLILNIVL